MMNRITNLAETFVIAPTQQLSAPEPTRGDPLCPTIFHEPWWLKIATGGAFAVTEVREDGRVVGRMPYVVVRRLGLAKVVMPTLTHFLGPVTDQGEGSAQARFRRRLGITRALIRQLPAAQSIYIKCARCVPDVVAFQMEGFHAGVQFTFEVAPQPPDAIWRAMRDKTRNVIRQAEKQFDIVTPPDAEAFMRFRAANFRANGKTDSLDTALARRLIEACLERGRGRIYAAVDAKSALAAAIFCCWDRTASFYLVSTRRGDAGNGAISLLIWQAIQDAASMGLHFDMEGIGNAGSVSLYSGFGGNLSPRYIAVRESCLVRFIRTFKADGAVNHFV